MRFFSAGRILFFAALTANGVSAHGVAALRFTGLGVTAGYEYGSMGNPTPAIALTQGYAGLVSYYATVEAGYRTTDSAFMARTKLEAYFTYAGVYFGIQSNSGRERASDYGFPMGVAALIHLPAKWLLKLHSGAAIYTQEQAHEFQFALSAFYGIW